MRPKVVISVLVVAFGLLGLIAVLKGVSRKGPVDNGSTPVVADASSPSATNAEAALATAGGGTNSAAVSPEMHAAVLEQELEQISELRSQADDSNNATIITALLQKFSSPEPEVRAAALEALKDIDDTNAVPGLEKVSSQLSDPREKVAVLDAIDYIKLPSVTENIPREIQTNRVNPALLGKAPTNTYSHRKHTYNPAFLRNDRTGVPQANSQQAPPADTQAAQPQ